jgi:hypothetical protein
LLDQGGDGVCFLFATLYVICKWLFTLFAILYPSAVLFPPPQEHTSGYVKPDAFRPEEEVFLNANFTVDDKTDANKLTSLLSALLTINGDCQSYMYKNLVVYVFLFMIGIYLTKNINGEDPSKGGFSVSSLLMMIDFLYTVFANEPPLSPNDDDNVNFNNFKRFYAKYIAMSSFEKLKYPHNFNGYKILVFMMRRIKYGPGGTHRDPDPPRGPGEDPPDPPRDPRDPPDPPY